MSKFKELAEGIKGDLVNFNKQADELIKIREANRLRGEKIMQKHREGQTSLAADFAAMEQALADMEGSNSKNSEGSGDSSEKSFSPGAAKTT